MNEILRNLVIRYYSKWQKHLTKEMLDYIYNSTKFLDYKENVVLKERMYYCVNDKICEDLCKNCNGPMKFHGKLTVRKFIFCSAKCANTFNANKIQQKIIENGSREIAKERRKNTCLEKYGVDHVWKDKGVREKCNETSLKLYNGVCNFSDPQFIKNSLEKKRLKYGKNLEGISSKIKKTFIKKYGVDNIFQSEIIKEKIKNTCIKKYGKKHYTQTDEFKNKTKITCLKKYGFDHYLKNDSMKNKWKNSFKEKYNVEYPYQNKKIKDKCLKTFRNNFYDKFKTDLLENKKIQLLSTIDDFCNLSSTINFKCLKCNKFFKSKGTNIQQITCECRKFTSISEKEISNWLKSLNIKVIENSRNIIPPLELDIYLPDYNLAIEFNGLYWHSDLFKNKNYHLNKTNLCKEQDIQLIHIFENEWDHKQNIVKSIILAKLGKFTQRIMARKCILKEISNIEYKDFCEQNHLQDWVPAKYKVGLFYNDELIQICSFGKNRFKRGEIELLRHCSKLNTQIIGRFI